MQKNDRLIRLTKRYVGMRKHKEMRERILQLISALFPNRFDAVEWYNRKHKHLGYTPRMMVKMGKGNEVEEFLLDYLVTRR